MATWNTKSFTWFNKKNYIFSWQRTICKSLPRCYTNGQFWIDSKALLGPTKILDMFCDAFILDEPCEKNLSMFYSLVKGFELYINMSMPLKVFSRKVCLRIGKTFFKPCDEIYLYVSVTYNWRPTVL